MVLFSRGRGSHLGFRVRSRFLPLLDTSGYETMLGYCNCLLVLVAETEREGKEGLFKT